MQGVVSGMDASAYYAESTQELEDRIGAGASYEGLPDPNTKRMLLRENKRLCYEYLAKFSSEALVQVCRFARKGGDVRSGSSA